MSDTPRVGVFVCHCGSNIGGFLDVPGFWADYARELSFMEMFGSADSRFYEVYTSYHELDDAFEQIDEALGACVHDARAAELLQLVPGGRQRPARPCEPVVEQRAEIQGLIRPQGELP